MSRIFFVTVADETMYNVQNTEGLHGGKRSLNKKRGRLGKLSLEEQTGKDGDQFKYIMQIFFKVNL